MNRPAPASFNVHQAKRRPLKIGIHKDVIVACTSATAAGSIAIAGPVSNALASDKRSTRFRFDRVCPQKSRATHVRFGSTTDIEAS
jgi:hypothetical protein